MNDIVRLKIDEEFIFSIDDWFDGWDDKDDFKKWFNNKYKDGVVNLWKYIDEYTPLNEVRFDGMMIYEEYVKEVK